MAVKDRMSGNEAVAFAIRQINPDVMPAFRSHLQQRFRRWYPPTSPMGRLIRNLSGGE